MTDPEPGRPDPFDEDFRRAYERALREFDAEHGDAATRWQRFSRWRARRLLRRRLYDRSITRW